MAMAPDPLRTSINYLSGRQCGLEMPADVIRLSEFVRVKEQDGEFTLQARDEAGRGKRFGTSGEFALATDEAQRFAKWVFARELDRCRPSRGRRGLVRFRRLRRAVLVRESASIPRLSP